MEEKDTIRVSCLRQAAVHGLHSSKYEKQISYGRKGCFDENVEFSSSSPSSYVQHLKYNTFADLTPETWSHVRLKGYKIVGDEERRRSSHRLHYFFKSSASIMAPFACLPAKLTRVISSTLEVHLLAAVGEIYVLLSPLSGTGLEPPTCLSLASLKINELTLGKLPYLKQKVTIVEIARESVSRVQSRGMALIPHRESLFKFSSKGVVFTLLRNECLRRVDIGGRYLRSVSCGFKALQEFG
ncbi:hypothetical protein J6590_063699 [Homalodisca vitripennis]|nr:hypothetical protein J6590_063699 [Homalodisca vitripennis]